MTLQQLKYFCVMAKVLHYTQAAETLYISQPTLSYAISELEKEFCVPLFEKQDRQIVLTKFGRTFLPYAQAALDAISNGTHAIEQLNHPIIDLGYVYSLSFDYMPKLIEEFYKFLGHRKISFSFHEGFTLDMIEKLKSGDLDMVFSTKTGDPTVNHLPVFKQELYLVVPKGHRLTEFEQVSIDDLKDENFITLNPNHPMRLHIDEYFRSADIDPKVIFSVDEFDAICAFISSNIGISIMPLTPSLSSHNVSILKIKDPPVRIVYLLTKKNQTYNKIIQVFYNFLLEKSKLLED